MERHRFLACLLGLLAFRLPASPVVLEIAPSAYTTPLLRRVAPGRLISVDLDPAADQRSVDVCASLTKLPLPAASVDLLLCFHVLEHIPRDRAAMHEIARVLQPSGVGVIQVPWRQQQPTDEDPSLGPHERTRRFGQADHVRFYGADFEDRLLDAGLVLVRVTALECLGERLCFWLGVPHQDPIWVVAPRSGGGLPAALMRATELRESLDSLALHEVRAAVRAHPTEASNLSTPFPAPPAPAGSATGAQTSRAVRNGFCHVCGYGGSFELMNRSPREGFQCPDCRASLRYQHQAQVIVDLYGGDGVTTFAELAGQACFRGLRLYEPALTGPFIRHLAQHPAYVRSYLWPGVSRGAVHEGVRCESLERLTFADGSFDLVLTSDVFEHVRRPWAAFESLYRVLRPGGRHVMSIPVTHPVPAVTRARVDTTTDEDVLLEEPVYHGSPHDPKGSLVYTDFGADLPGRLADVGFEVSVHHGPWRTLTYVMRRPPTGPTSTV